jgi:hypothetical protein
MMSDNDATKTVDLWVGMWRDLGIQANDVGYAVIDAIVESGDATLFLRLPLEIQNAIRGVISRFRSTGIAEISSSSSTAPIDISQRLQRFDAILKSHGID